MANIIDIFVPDLGDDKDVDLIEVLVSLGDRVEEDDGLITLETEKASMDVPTTHAGVIKEILVEVGMKVNSGDIIARIEVEEENSNEANEVVHEDLKSKETPLSKEDIDLKSVEIIIQKNWFILYFSFMNLKRN